MADVARCEGFHRSWGEQPLILCRLKQLAQIGCLAVAWLTHNFAPFVVFRLQPDVWPGLDRVGCAHELHASVREALEGSICVVGVVDDRWIPWVRTWDDHRRGAVFEQVDLSRQGWILRLDVLVQIGDGPGNAVALGLAGDDECIAAEQPLDEESVPLRHGCAIRLGQDLWSEHRVVLGKEVASLNLELRLTRAGDAVEEAGFLDCRHERVADAAEHTVEGPDRQGVLAARLEAARVVQCVALNVREVGGLISPVHYVGNDSWIDLPDSLLDVSDRDGSDRCWVFTLLVHPERWMKDLHEAVGVQRRDRFGDDTGVLVEELAQPSVVVGCSTDEQLEFRMAEGELTVDQHDADAELVRGRRLDAVLP